jgi:hypothetical protein
MLIFRQPPDDVPLLGMHALFGLRHKASDHEFPNEDYKLTNEAKTTTSSVNVLNFNVVGCSLLYLVVQIFIDLTPILKNSAILNCSRCQPW